MRDYSRRNNEAVECGDWKPSKEMLMQFLGLAWGLDAKSQIQSHQKILQSVCLNNSKNIKTLIGMELNREFGKSRSQRFQPGLKTLRDLAGIN